MINIEITLNGEDYESFKVMPSCFTYKQLKDAIKTRFSLNIDDDFEIFDFSNKEFSISSLTTNVESKFQLALLNKRRNHIVNQFQSQDSIEEIKGKSNVMIDEISKYKYSCYHKGCRKTFKSPDKLFSHIKNHYKNKPFRCEFEGCGKSFLCKGQLRNHQTTHAEQKRFHCKYPGCDLSYPKKSRLLVHERIHTGERPFVCPFEGCGKSFSEKGNLKTHIRTHTGEKPYFCSFKGCGKRFTTQGHLVDHERRHRDEKPYKCDICGRAFMRSSTVKVHMKTHERNVIEVKPMERKSINKLEVKVETAEDKIIPIMPQTIKQKVPEFNDLDKMLAPKPSTPTNAGVFQRIISNQPFRQQERPPLLKPSYSLIATITSSRGEMFDNACNNVPQKQKNKKVGIILPSINRINMNEGCLLNKSKQNKSNEWMKNEYSALNNLSARIMEDDPLI